MYEGPYIRDGEWKYSKLPGAGWNIDPDKMKLRPPCKKCGDDGTKQTAPCKCDN